VAPALFALANNTAAALHTNYQVVSSSNRSYPGETISLYATALGTYTQHGDLQVLDNTPQVMIDGIQATVSFAGRAPGYQGLDQINVQVPADAHRG
jgi:uncharacterized protein (TIGR03437 family)